MKNQKVILITGASRGIGQYLLKDLRKNPLNTVYGASRKKDPTDKLYLELDVTDSASCVRAVEQILTEQGKIDVLINNAGSHLTGASEETSLEEIDQQMKLNFYGAIYMIKAVTPVFLEQRSGKIINMSSLGGLISLPYTSAYNASKFALEGYTESLRLELLPLGIYVSNIEAAYINSGTVEQSIISPMQEHSLFSPYRKRLHQQMLGDSVKGIPLSAIAKQTAAIIEASTPKFRHKIGKLAKQLTLLHFFTPERMFENTILKTFRIPKRIEYPN